MGVEDFRKWLSLIFRKIGGLRKQNHKVEEGIEPEDKLLRFYSSTNYELPETLCDKDGKNKTCENLVYFIDITQILTKAYQKTYYNLSDQHNAYNNFERYIVSRIISQLSNLNFNICPICNKKSSGFNSWNYSSKKQDSVNKFDAPKPDFENSSTSTSCSNTNEHQMNLPCSCSSTLNICETIVGIYRYLEVNKNKSYRIVLLYDSRNLNPLARFITHGGRYKKQTNVTEDMITKWFEDHPTFKGLGYDGPTNFEQCNKNTPIISYNVGKKFKEDVFFSGYLKTSFLLFAVENWIMRLKQKIFNTLQIMKPIKNTNQKSNCYLSGEFDKSNNFEFIVDSTPTRAYKMFEACDKASSYSFSGKDFLKNFKIYYGDTIGVTQNKMRFYADKMVSKLKNIDVSEDIEEYIYNDPDYLCENVYLSYPNEINNNNEYDNNDNDDDNVSIDDQNSSVSRRIGESDIKMLPYIKSFVDNVVDESNDIESTFRVVVNSEDSDIILISLLFVSNCSSMNKRIGRFVTKNPNIFKDKRLSFVVDRGVKTAHDNYKKIECETEKSEKSKSFLRMASQKNMVDEICNAETTEMFDIDECEMNIYEGDMTPKKRVNLSMNMTPNDENVSSKGIEMATMNEKDFGNIRMIDIIGLYNAMTEYLSVDCVETFIFFMFMSGSDYTSHPPGMGIAKFIDVFEKYANTKPFYLFSDSNPSENLTRRHSTISDCINHDPHLGNILVRTTKNENSYMWVCNKERMFVFGILLYLSRVPAVAKTIKKNVEKKLDQKMKGLLLNDVSVRSIYDYFREEVLKKNQDSDYFWSSKQFLGEMYRCTWTINYYLGTEFFSTHSVERKLGNSIWGWTLVPVINSGTITTFQREMFNFLESQISFYSSMVFDDGETVGDKIEEISKESHPWKRYLRCLDCIMKITKKEKSTLIWSVVEDNYLIFDHYSL